MRAARSTARATAANTVTHPGRDKQPMSDSGEQQIDADSNKPVPR